jgi:hypothetical protein
MAGLIDPCARTYDRLDQNVEVSKVLRDEGKAARRR